MANLLKIIKVLLILHLVSAKEYYKVELKHCSCSANKVYVKNITCSYKPKNRTTKFATLDVYFHDGVKLSKPLYLEFVANKKFGTVYRQSMVHIKEDLCDFLLLKNHPAFQIMNYNVKRSNSNLMDPCPYMGHRFLKSVSSDYKNLPPLIPIGEWRIDTIVTRSKDKYDWSDEVFRFVDHYHVSATDAEQF